MNRQSPNVLIRPPRLFILTMLVAFVLDYFFPLAFIEQVGAVIAWSMRYVGVVLIVCGFMLASFAMQQFRRQATPVETWKPSTQLVTGGLFQHSRNPIYVAMFVIYVGVGMTVMNVYFMVLLPVLFFVMQWGVVKQEERYLAYCFGEAYAQYRCHVRRWL